MVRWGLGLMLAGSIIACGSGGSSDPSTSSSGSSGASSSSSSSSGASSSSSGASSSSTSSGANCGAICFSGATFSIQESNAAGRLDGARIEVCFRETCESGTLSAKTGGEYTLAFPAGSKTQGSARAGTTADTVRFDLQWVITFGTSNDVRNGDRYAVRAYAADAGATLFAHEYEATYLQQVVCGSVCEVFRVGS